MKIDFHIHAFPDHLAERAIPSIAGTADKMETRVAITPVTNGTIAETRSRLAEYGIDAGVLMPIATKPGHQRHLNDWAAQENHGNIISFGSVHPRDPQSTEELERILELGLKGVKLHPDYQGFFADDPIAYPIYEKLEQLGLPVLFHVGRDPFSPMVTHCRPKAIAQIAKDFPRLTVVGAHLGGIGLYDEAEEYLYREELPNLFVDVSMAHVHLDKYEIRRMIRMIGAEHVLFASDMPWSSAKKGIEDLESAGLTSGELDRIFYKNALRILQIPAERIGGAR